MSLRFLFPLSQKTPLPSLIWKLNKSFSIKKFFAQKNSINIANRTKNNINHNFSFSLLMGEVFRVKSLEFLSEGGSWIYGLCNQWSDAGKHETFASERFQIDYFSHYFQQFSFHPVESSLAKNKFYRAIFKPIGLLLLIAPIFWMMLLSCRMTLHMHRAQKRLQLPPVTEGPEKVSLLSFCILNCFSTSL